MSSRSPCVLADGSRKRSYPSQAAAEKDARKLNRKKRNDAPARPYLCPDCHRFHVGHGSFEP